MGVYYFYSDNVLEDGIWKSKSIHIEDGCFTRSFSSIDGIQEINVDRFWVGPGKVYVDEEESVFDALSPETTAQKYVNRGCTLLLCRLPIRSSISYKKRFKTFKNNLSFLPIDHMIVPTIPIRILKPHHIKFFGRMKVPLILVEVSDVTDLDFVKWEWIQEAQQFSRTPIMIREGQRFDEKNGRQLFPLWQTLCEDRDIITLQEPVTELPLSKNTLRITGISPGKGELIENGCADYNLFSLEKDPTIDGDSHFRYHKAIPTITVSRGKVVKENHLVNTEKMQGEYMEVSIPRHFIDR
ncbi:hypothetical protein KO561_10305 [Radiobacillus kanasensis]|uniref:hypothetical protein n=1 Tax=Radiobacillus kanasensis TaxID=2844358 RepID=UPI001E57DD6C|nr:hypothetical protein [Radiobacillus kanasensis]UFT97618.1 hypothetical protein KO561_10305 [Radiobacillus kanasensis]